MTTKDYILFSLVLLLAGMIIYFNSCNKPVYDNSQLEQLKQLIIEDTTKAGFNKRQADSILTAISKRDSISNITINNIFTNGTEEKKQIISTPVDVNTIIGINSMLDSIIRANR
jgi:hypothetical protein